jgi:hypothetical protein
MLQANGIPSVLVVASTISVLEFQVQVPRVVLEEACRLIAEAQEVGAGGSGVGIGTGVIAPHSRAT